MKHYWRGWRGLARLSVLAYLLGFTVAALAQSWVTIFSASWFLDSTGNSGYEIRTVMPALSQAITQAQTSYNAQHGGATSYGHMSVCVQLSGSTCKAPPVEVTCQAIMGPGVSGLNLPANAAAANCDPVNISANAGDVILSIVDVASSGITRNTGSTLSYYSVTTTWNQPAMGGAIQSAPAPYGIAQVQVINGPPPPPPPPPPASLTSPGIPGGGRLTLVHGQSRMTQDVTASYVDYAPDEGAATVPMINASGALVYVPFTTSQTDTQGPSLVIDSSWGPGTVHDYLMANVGGQAVPCSVQWSSGTVPAAQDTMIQNVRVNGVALSACRTSPTTTVQCPVGQCTVEGAFVIDAGAGGQVSCTFSAGQNRRCGIWNLHHQQELVLKVTNPTLTPFIYNMLGNQQPQAGGGLAPVPAFGSMCSNPAQGGPCFAASGAWGPLGSDPTLSASVFAGRNIGGRVHITGYQNHRNLEGEAIYTTPGGQNVVAPNTPNTAYSIGVGWTAPGASTWQVCGNYSASTYPLDSLGVNGSMNEEAAANVVFAATRTTACEPAPFLGVAQAMLIEAQWWYYGQEWIDSGDTFGIIRAPY